MPKLLVVLATHNAHKVEELRAILAAHLDPETIVSAKDVGATEPVEDGTSFAENSLIKARALAAHTGLIALADDSGICVDVMNGAPGIFSALWSGKHGQDQENLDLLLAQMADIPAKHRAASFRCAASMVTPDGLEHVEMGILSGALATHASGGVGFGYDPIFIPEGETRTLAQFSAAEKNAISHRRRAFTALAPHVARALSTAGALPPRSDR